MNADEMLAAAPEGSPLRAALDKAFEPREPEPELAPETEPDPTIEIPDEPIPYALTLPVYRSVDSATRKLMPVASGCLAYFPDALLLVAWVSRVGNEKHNPGQPLHWAKEKSTDEFDCEVRHMLDYFRGLPADPGLEPLGDLGHLASKAWRALAHLQRACDANRTASENAAK